MPGFLLFLLLSAAPGSPIGPRSLSYVESSTGLMTPDFEGGDTEFEMGDVNGDGHVDLVSVGDHGNPLIGTAQEGILVWLGDGHGAWSHVRYGHLGYGGVALGDVDGDGVVDVGYGIHHDYGAPSDLGDSILEVALGNGTGSSWTPWDDGLAGNGEYYGMFSTDFGDVEGDGDLDVGSTGFGSTGGMHVYLNGGDGTWARGFGFLEGNSGHVFAFGDVDGDGHRDVVTAKQEGTVWLGDGEGFYTTADGNLPPIGEFEWRAGPSLGDVDRDGKDDLAYCDASANALVWLWRDGTWLDASGALPATGTCEHTQLHDMDGDGLVDLATFGEGNVHVFRGDGTGAAWTEIATFTTPDTPGYSRCFRVGGDVDHNGYPDLVLVDEKRISTFEYRNMQRCYRESSVADSLAVRVVSPGPNRRLLAGSVSFVEWAASVPAGATATATLELSTTGTGGPWEAVATGLPNSGRHQWVVPSRLSTDARLRVTVDTGAEQANAVSASPFEVARRPDPVTLTFTDGDTVAWQDSLARDRHQMYRSSLSRLVETGEYTQDPADEPLAARFCDLEAPSIVDPFVPPPGETLFYLVTGYRLMEDGQQPGVAVPMAEGALGQDGQATMRPNDRACPVP